jgi:ActR/RegA family two-component response regulator
MLERRMTLLTMQPAELDGAPAAAIAPSPPGRGWRVGCFPRRVSIPDRPAVATGRLVLLGENDLDLRSLIADHLEEHGWRVVALGLGPETLIRLWLETFTAAIIDVRSLASAGFKVLVELIEIDSTLPVIVIASFGDVSVSRCAYSMGAFHVLEKPFDLEELDRALAALPRWSSAGPWPAGSRGL